MRIPSARIAAAGIALLTLAEIAAAHQLLVGRNGANRIVMELDDGPVYDLGPSFIPGIDGFADAEPGFVGNGDDFPAEDFFMIPPTADIEFVLISAEPHIAVWNDTGSAHMLVGETYHVGVGFFHNHPVWHSPDGTPGEVYELEILLRDRAGLLSDSEVYAIGFRPVPEPGMALMLLVGAAAVARRR